MPRRSAPHIYVVGAIALITMLGAGVRLVNINESLWLDELHSSWSVAGSFLEVASRAADGNQPPLYYWVAWIFKQVLGDSEFSERSLSLVCGTAIIPLAWWTVKRFSGSDIGAIAACALVAFDPNLIHYSIEFRAYIAVALVGVLQTAAFARLLIRDPVLEIKAEPEAVPEQHDQSGKRKRGRKRATDERSVTSAEEIPCAETHENMFQLRIVFVLLTLLMFHLHYTSILLLFFQVVITCVALCFARIRNRYSLMNMLVDGAIIAAGCLPALFHLMKISGKKDDWIAMVSVAKVEPELIAMLAGYVIPAGLIALSWVLVRGMSADKSGRPLSPLGRVAIFGLGFLSLIGITWLLTYTRIAALFHLRYVAAAFALPMLSIGLGVGLFRNKFAQTGVSVFAIVVAVISIYHFNGWARASMTSQAVLSVRSEGWERVVRDLNSRDIAERENVFLLPALVEDHRLNDDEVSQRFVDYCKFPVAGLYVLDPEKYDVIPRESMPRLPYPDREHYSEEHLQSLKDGSTSWILARGYFYNKRGEIDFTMPAPVALHEFHFRLLDAGFMLKHEVEGPYGSIQLVKVWAEKIEVPADSDAKQD